MLRSATRADLSLLDQGISLGIGYGFHAVVELARLGELLLHSVYEPGSLRIEGGRAAFTLRNPPLRMGAFSAVRVLWDGTEIPAGQVTVVPDGLPPRPSAEVDRDRPLTIPVGARCEFLLHPTAGDSHRHRIRLELQSIAIPPKVWFEFSDVLLPGPAP
ncbi:MAG: hypothetical protein L3K19_00575 [Thermoplasmata archaeon]|nr:hypothetical protein [Thermoplasmata archaeon]